MVLLVPVLGPSLLGGVLRGMLLVVPILGASLFRGFSVRTIALHSGALHSGTVALHSGTVALDSAMASDATSTLALGLLMRVSPPSVFGPEGASILIWTDPSELGVWEMSLTAALLRAALAASVERKQLLLDAMFPPP